MLLTLSNASIKFHLPFACVLEKDPLTTITAIISNSNDNNNNNNKCLTKAAKKQYNFHTFFARIMKTKSKRKTENSNKKTKRKFKQNPVVC